MKKIILASNSPRRKEIFKKTNLPFKVVVSNYKEDFNIKLPPKELVMHFSKGKAKEVSNKNKDAVVIGADTLVVFNNEILGKPKSQKEAEETLEKLSGKFCTVITGFTVMEKNENNSVSKAVSSKVFFKKLNKEDISGYVKSKEPLDKAGSFGIQGLGSILIDKIEGEYYNIVGLPLGKLVEELKKFGISIW